MVNKVILQGRLTKDVKVEDVNGFNKASFTIAWNEEYKEVKKECFLNCEAWRHTAEFISNFFSKGKEIVVEGQMITTHWEKEGQTQYRTFCNVEKAHFCGPKGSNTENNPPSTPSNDFVNVPEGSDEELPFV